MPKKNETYQERALRARQNRGLPKILLVREYTRPNGIKREVFLHVTKGFRDRRAS